MANCPNCKTKLPFTRIALLSRIKNQFECNSCSKNLSANKTQLGIIGGIAGAIVAVLIFWNKEIFGPNSSSLILAFISSLVVLLITALIQNSIIQLEYSESETNNE